MNTRELLIRKSLLALIVGSISSTAPVYAQQQTDVPPPQLQQGDPATERVNDLDLNAPTGDTAQTGAQSQAPQPDEVGEDQAVSEAAVDLNADPMMGNRPEERPAGPNTLRFGGDNTERPAGAIVTETEADTEGAGTADADAPAPATDATVAAENEPATDAEVTTDEAPAEATGVASDVAPEEPVTAEIPRRVEGVYPLPIEDLTDRHVVNAAGQMLGEVEVAVVNEASGEAGLVVSVGNLTGVATAQALAPADQLNLSGDLLIWNTPHDPNQIAEVQAYEPADYREIVGSYNSLDDASRALSEPTR